MRAACKLVIAAVVAATVVAPVGGPRPLGAQDAAGPRFASTAGARYLPLASVRDGVVSMPKSLARRVSVRYESATLQQVLMDIATQAGLGLSYGEELPRSRTLVSIDLKAATAAEALAAAVRDTRWAVMVNPAGQVAVLSAEQLRIGSVVGRVTDKTTKQGVADATVILEGTRLAATTNAQGNYRIANVPPGSYTVVVRRIGYARATQTVSVSDNEPTTVDFALDLTSSTLDRVVVTGVPTATSKRALGNSIGTVDVAAEVEKTSSNTVAEVLQARVPGVTVMTSSGTPGAASTIRIRGTGSLSSSSDPVVFVDGVRISSGAAGNFRNSWETPNAGLKRSGGGQDATLLGTINPEDIESIEVVKGPAASTLYGAEAANGVIQIITKKGRTSKPEWNARIQRGQTDWGLARNTSYTTCTAARIAATLPDNSPAWPGCQGQAPGTVLSLTSLDQEGALRGGDLINYGLSVRGGATGYTYYTGIDHDVEQGVFANSETRRTAARANFTVTPNSRVNYGVNLGVSHSEVQFPQGDNAANILESAWTFTPGIALGRGQSDGFAAGNPEQMDIYDNRLRTDRVTLASTFNVNPSPKLANRLTLGADMSFGQANRYIAPGSLWSPVDGQMTQGAPKNNVYTIDYAGTLTTNAPLLRNAASAFSWGAQYNYRQYRNTIAQGTSFPSSSTRDIVLSAQRSAWSEYEDIKSLGMYLQEQLGWGERFYVTSALRVDNSSVFGDDIKPLYYPKLSASYVLTEHQSFRQYGWLNQLRVRGAWGQAGNAPPPFAKVRSYVSSPGIDSSGNPVPMLRLDNEGNPDVKPERGVELELGVDMGMLNDRLTAELTWYDKTTRDAIMAVQSAPSEGYTTFRYENLGEISNRGFEIALGAIPWRDPKFTWDSRLTLSTNTNELVRFGYARDPITFGLTTANQRHAEGYALGGFWVHTPVRAADGSYSASEAKYRGPSNPTREVAFANTFTLFHNWSLYGLIDYKGGFYVLNQTEWRRCAAGTCAEVNDPGRSAQSIEELRLDLGMNDGLYTQRGDFMKLRDLSLSYSLPEGVAQRGGASRARLTLSGHNLAMLWKSEYTGLDPEVNFAGDNGPTGAWGLARVDYWTMPMTRRVTFAVDLTF